MQKPTKKRAFQTWVWTVSLAFLPACDDSPQAVAPGTPPPLPTPMAVNALPSGELQAGTTREEAPRAPATNEEREAKPTPGEIAAEYRSAMESERRAELVQELWEIGTPEAVETLRQLFFTEREPGVKVDIISGLASATRPELRDVRHALAVAALTPGQPAEVRSLAVHLLTESDDPRATGLLQGFAQDADPQVREAAREALEARKESQ